MSDTAVKVLATVAGLAGLGFAGAAFVGAGTRKPNPSSDDGDAAEEQVNPPDIYSFHSSASLERDKGRYRELFARYSRDRKLPEPVTFLGCGGFGCVWRTTSPGIVLKATTDEGEIHVSRMLAAEENPPAGFVRYLARGDLGDYELLWREEIAPIEEKEWDTLLLYEKLAKVARRAWDWAEYQDEFAALIGVLWKQTSGWDVKLKPKSRKIAPVVLNGKLIDISNWSGSEDEEEAQALSFIVAVRAATLAAKRIKDPDLRLVAEAIRWALSRGIMLCDVSWSNLGIVDRVGHDQLVIFDPGYTVNVPTTEVA